MKFVVVCDGITEKLYLSKSGQWSKTPNENTLILSGKEATMIFIKMAKIFAYPEEADIVVLHDIKLGDNKKCM